MSTSASQTILIVGGGLAGLTAARLLHRAGVEFKLLEARERLGGRILSVDATGEPSGDGFDLGASWFWPDMKYEPVPVENNADVQQKYLAGGCDVYTSDGSDLASTRSSFKNPEHHIILPEVISKEPLGPLVRQGDDQWADVARWTLNALISAEELGITAENVEKLSAGSDNPDVNRLLGKEDKLGEMLGLDAEWAKRAIAAEGNYGEIFARNLGDKTPIALPRGLNAVWTDGGLMYGLPLR